MAVPAAIVALAVTAGIAAATPAQDLDRARDAFRRSEYLNAIPVLSSLLYPAPRLARVDDLAEAHVLLGACALETGDRPTASREFDEAINLRGDLALDASQLFSPAAIDLFNERKEEIARRNKAEAEKALLAAKAEAYERMLASMVIVEKRSYYINFLPFGAGQFQNGQTRKGLAFAAAEGVTGGISAGIWLYLVGTYGISGGHVDPEKVDGVRLLQQIEIGTGAVCIGLMAWGVVDSLIHYKPSVQRRPDESVLPPELRKKLQPKPEAPPPKPPGTSFNFAPTPMPHGAGVVFSWEF